MEIVVMMIAAMVKAVARMLPLLLMMIKMRMLRKLLFEIHGNYQNKIGWWDGAKEYHTLAKEILILLKQINFRLSSHSNSPKKIFHLFQHHRKPNFTDRKNNENTQKRCLWFLFRCVAQQHRTQRKENGGKRERKKHTQTRCDPDMFDVVS